MIVSSEADALDALENVMFDAMIIDTETLGFSSAQFVKLVKMARLGARALPVIALTVNREGPVSRELDKIGIEAILTKPVPPGRLLDILSRISRNQASSRDL